MAGWSVVYLLGWGICGWRVYILDRYSICYCMLWDGRAAIIVGRIIIIGVNEKIMGFIKGTKWIIMNI